MCIYINIFGLICFLQKGNLEPMAVCGSFSISYVRKYKPVTQVSIQVSHFFYILLRFLHFDLEQGTYECGFYATCEVRMSHGLPWIAANYGSIRFLCGKIPAVDLYLKSNRIQVALVSKIQFVTMGLTFVYSVIDMTVIIINI